MAKLTLSDFSSLSNQTSFLTALNANFALVEAALENTLSRDGTSPNSMGADLDMNSNNILNLPAAASATEPVRLQEFQALETEFDTLETNVNNSIAALQAALDSVDSDVAAAAASAAAAAVSAAAALAAQTAAELAETNAETAETNAETAETNAETAQAAAELAQTAAEAAQAAAESAESNASASASSASASASNAATSESNAATSETNAAASESAAAASATSAAASFDAFDDIYLGSKAANPTLDNDGDALVEGQLYWNSSANELRIYDGASWNAYSPSTSSVGAFLDLTDVPSAYTGEAGKFLFVNDDEDGLEFSANVRFDSTGFFGDPALLIYNTSNTDLIGLRLWTGGSDPDTDADEVFDLNLSNTGGAAFTYGGSATQGLQFRSYLDYQDQSDFQPIQFYGVPIEFFSNYDTFSQTLTIAKTGITATIPITVPADAFDSGWNGDNTVPTKNDIWDGLVANYQPLDSDLTSWAGVTRASGFDTFVATPSSSNLRSLLTDETGTGSAVFANGPTFTGPFSISASDPTITLTDTDTGADCQISANGLAGSITFNADLNNEAANSLINFSIDGSAVAALASTAWRPSTNDLAALGTTSLSWSDLFLASGGVINWNNGDVTITHSSNALTFAGASSGYSFDALVDISGASAGQIKFPASQNASADANTLDDYEEGTFTPTLTTTGTDFDSVTYDGVRDGTYTKIGRAVLLAITMKTDAVTVGSATGTVRIGGLPFTAAGSSSQFTPIPVGYCAAWAGEEPLHAMVVGASTAANLYYRAAVTGDATATAIADVGTGANNNEIYLAGNYNI